MFILAFFVAGKTEYVYVRVTEPAKFAVEVSLKFFLLFVMITIGYLITFEELLLQIKSVSNFYNILMVIPIFTKSMHGEIV